MIEPQHRTRTRRLARRVTIVHAHTGDQAYVYLVLNGPDLVGSVQLPLEDLEGVTNQTGIDRVDGASLEGSSMAAVQSYVLDHFSIRLDGESIGLSLGETKVRMLSSGPYLYLDYSAPGVQMRRPGHLEVTYDVLIGSMPDRKMLLIALISRGWSGLYRHDESTFDFDKDQRRHIIEVREPTASENLKASIRQATRLGLGKARGLRRRLRTTARTT